MIPSCRYRLRKKRLTATVYRQPIFVGKFRLSFGNDHVLVGCEIVVVLHQYHIPIVGRYLLAVQWRRSSIGIVHRIVVRYLDAVALFVTGVPVAARTALNAFHHPTATFAYRCALVGHRRFWRRASGEKKKEQNPPSELTSRSEKPPPLSRQESDLGRVEKNDEKIPTIVRRHHRYLYCPSIKRDYAKHGKIARGKPPLCLRNCSPSRSRC